MMLFIQFIGGILLAGYMTDIMPEKEYYGVILLYSAWMIAESIDNVKIKVEELNKKAMG